MRLFLQARLSFARFSYRIANTTLSLEHVRLEYILAGLMLIWWIIGTQAMLSILAGLSLGSIIRIHVDEMLICLDIENEYLTAHFIGHIQPAVWMVFWIGLAIINFQATSWIAIAFQVAQIYIFILENT